MLECSVVILNVVIVVVGVGKEVAIVSEDICRGDVGRWKPENLGPLDFVDLARVVVEVFAHFVTQVGVGVFVTYHLDGVVDADGAVVGGEDDASARGGNFAEEFHGARVAEPRLGERAIGGIG